MLRAWTAWSDKVVNDVAMHVFTCCRTVPLAYAHLEGALQITVNDAKHSMIDWATDRRLHGGWYGADSVIDS